jgi:hypothetical protein
MTNLNGQMVEVLNGVKSEILVDKEGKGSITKYGLSKMLGISKDVLMRDRLAQKLVESLTAKGFSLGDLSFENSIPDLAVSCIVEYYAFDAQRTSETAKLLFRAFAAVGVRAWFQEVTGYEKVKAKAKTELEKIKENRDYMNQMIAVMEYAANKPGQQNINNFAVGLTGKELPGLLTLDDILARTGREYSSEEKSAIGMYAATAYRNLTGVKPEQVVKRYVTEKGNHQKTKVAAYPIDFLPVIENAIELGFNS